MKRFAEQRWLLDAIVRTVGLDWDQGRTGYTMAATGPAAMGDLMGVRNRVQKFSDVPREFARAARRREMRAKQYEQEGRLVAARESYFIASLLYGNAMWAIFANTPENIEYNGKKVDCYVKYTQLAPHKARRVEIPFEGKSLPGYLHLPPKASASSPAPCVLAISGMDGFKEISVSMYGDRMLERGIGVLAMDGPGQGECCVRDMHCTATNYADAGRAMLAWLREQPEVDRNRIALSGVSMGSFWATQVAANDDHLQGCGVAYVCYEPGLKSLLDGASPTFKLRYMYMAGFDDEAAFDRFAETITLDGFAERVKCPYLAIAGEDDELSPIENAYELMKRLGGPKELLVYEGEKHSMPSAPSSMLGPNPMDYRAEWLADRLAGKPMESRNLFVDFTGKVQSRSWD
ncbi:MAG TPA: alpha/beta hydrolase [Patescibacteria group bacterium]|nr:alpha/beta hydrolase [Patescibacteria group bacterium]